MTTPTIQWQYIPASRPNNLTHTQILESIKRAMNEWNNALKGIVNFNQGDKNCRLALIFDHIDTVTHPDRIGECRETPKGWEIAFNIKEKWNVGGWRKLLGVGYTLGSTVLHEIGHVLDLPHSDDPSFIMFPEYNEQLKLNKKEIADYRKFLIDN
ncbi:MAG: matrixin family metalloprotease [bacterium]